MKNQPVRITSGPRWNPGRKHLYEGEIPYIANPQQFPNKFYPRELQKNKEKKFGHYLAQRGTRLVFVFHIVYQGRVCFPSCWPYTRMETQSMHREKHTGYAQRPNHTQGRGRFS
jgi:hypothetical protein